MASGMDSQRVGKGHLRIAQQTERPNVRRHRPMQQHLSGDTPSTSQDARDLYVTGISVSKLKDQNLKKAPVMQNSASSRNVTLAQISGWRLKTVPVNNLPIICSYSTPLQLTLHGHPFITSSPRAQHFVRHFGRPLAPSDSASWWNYQFAAYTVLSRNPGKSCRASQRLAAHGHNPPQKQEGTTCSKQFDNYLSMKPLLTDATTATCSKHNTHILQTQYKIPKNKDADSPGPGDGSGNNLGRRSRNQKSVPSSGRTLIVPASHADSRGRIGNTQSALRVLSPEPWPSPHTPEEEEISIIVPLLPKLDNSGQ
ncbi:uncharacterized protein RB166_021325 [Leptodactylus fuscus]